MLPVTSHLENEAFKKTTKYIKISVHRNISRTILLKEKASNDKTDATFWQNIIF